MNISFDLHSAVSKNKRDTRTRSGRKVQSAAWKRYLYDVGWAARAAMNAAGAKIATGKVIVAIYVGTDFDQMDAQNLEEGIFDGMEGVVYRNDRQVCKHVVERTDIQKYVTVVVMGEE